MHGVVPSQLMVIRQFCGSTYDCLIKLRDGKLRSQPIQYAERRSVPPRAATHST